MEEREGVYIASESSFQRVPREHGQNAHRGRARAPGQLWCWDMTYLPAQIQGRWFYFYLILDLYSRMIVGWEIHEIDDAEHAVSVGTKPWKYLLVPYEEITESKRLADFLRFESGA